MGFYRYSMGFADTGQTGEFHEESLFQSEESVKASQGAIKKLAFASSLPIKPHEFRPVSQVIATPSKPFSQSEELFSSIEFDDRVFAFIGICSLGGVLTAASQIP